MFGDVDFTSDLTKVDDQHYTFYITSMEQGTVNYTITLTGADTLTIVGDYGWEITYGASGIHLSVKRWSRTDLFN